MGHLKDNIHIDAPVDKVFAYMDDPHNWATFMVGMAEPDKIIGDGKVGTQYEFTVLMAGIHMHLSTRLVEDQRDPNGGAHSRFDISGASSGWQTWDLKPENGGARVAVEMEYTVPGSILGKVADRLVIERMQERDMQHSLENLKLLLEGSPA